MEDGALYFLLGIPWQEYPALCRYRMAEKTYDHVTLPGLRAYVPQGAGQGLAVCEDGDETLVYGIDWADQQPQISLRLQGRWEAFAWMVTPGFYMPRIRRGRPLCVSARTVRKRERKAPMPAARRRAPCGRGNTLLQGGPPFTNRILTPPPEAGAC